MRQATELPELTPQKEKAALLFAAAELTTEEIARECDTSRQTLFLWRKEPAFIAKVRSEQSDIHRSIRSSGIAVLENRVRALHDRWRRLQLIVKERAADPALIDIPGGASGFIVRKGKCGYGIDKELLDAIRELEKQAAQELGQWEEKFRHAGADGGPIQIEHSVDLSRLSADELRTLRELRVKAGAEQAPGEN